MTNHRRIALVSESDLIGGAETMMLHLGTALRERGWEVHFVGPRNGCGWLGSRMTEAGITSHAFHLRRALDPACLVELVGLLRRARIDIVHSHMFAMAVYGAAATMVLRKPHVITLHGDAEQTRFLRRRIALRWAFRRAHAVAAVSEAMKRDLCHALGTTESRIRVIVNGVPETHGHREETRARLGLEQGERLLLAVGSYCRRKGHDVLLHAVAGLPPDLRWQVAIAGPDSDASEELRQMADREEFRGRVTLLGPRSDIGDLLAAADLFVMPSRWEGLPLALIEAMFASTPIVAAAVGGIPEAIRSDNEGLLVAAGNPVDLRAAIRQALEYPDCAAAMARQALAVARARYSITAMTDAYEGLYATA